MRSDNWNSQVSWAMVNYILPEFGMRALVDIRKADVQRFFNGLPSLTNAKGGRRLSPESIRRIRIVFSGIMAMAYDDEKVPRNPVSKIKLESSAPVMKDTPTIEEFASVYAQAGPRLQAALLVMGCLGLRVGEACGLARRDFGKVAVVKAQVLQVQGGSHLSEKLKTRSSYRSIHVPKELGKLLAGDGLYVIPAARGGYTLPNNISRELKAITDFTPHSFRRFFATQHGAIGTPVMTIQHLMGHKVPGITGEYQAEDAKSMARAQERFWEKISTHLTTQKTTD
jgi:integrase